MIIVVDANIIIAALLGSRGKLTILTSQNHTFYAPKKIIDEIRKYKTDICEKSGQTPEEFEQNFNALLTFITPITDIRYEFNMSKAREAISGRDVKDADYIACALAINAGFIWTDDKDFRAQNIVPIKSTADFIQAGKE